MTLPKRCRVKAWARRQSGSNNWLAAGEIRHAKSLKERWDFPKISRATSVVVERQHLNRLSSGTELNSATKLITHPPMQLMVRSGWTRSEEHTSELQSQFHLVCRLLLE